MQTYINSFLTIDKNLKHFKIFGYSSKGMPGLEVVGFGKYGRLFKEKLIYFTRSSAIKVSNRRYVICLEEEESRSLQIDHLAWFEMPALILFWTLADVLPLCNTDECYASGKLRATREIEDHELNEKLIHYFNDHSKVLIRNKSAPEVRTINFKDLLREAIDKKKLDQAI